MTSRTPHPYPKDWHRIRTAILKRDNNTCWRCGAEATTVDHITPIANGGTHEPDNLAACCATCNSSMGGQLGRGRQLGRTNAPTKPTKATQSQFFDQPALPPYVHGETLSVAPRGRTEARVHSPLLDGESRVAEVVALAERMGQPLAEWQEWLLRDALVVGENERFARRQILTLISRQNGKTHLAKMRIIAGLVLFGETRVFGLAQKLDTARQQWEAVVHEFQFNDALKQYGAQVRWANGQEELKVIGPNGPASYKILAASRRARGKTADLVYVDELREVPSDAWEAVTPFTTTTGGQIWATSNAGDLTSEALNNLRARILGNPSPRSALYEWSAPDGADIGDREAWLYANPMIGAPQVPEFTMDVLEDAFRSSAPSAFRTERMCQAVLSINPAIPMEAVEACATPDLDVAPELGAALWFAVDASPDSRRADLLVGRSLGDGKAGFKVLRTWESAGAFDDVRVSQEIAALASEWRPQAIAYNQYAAGNVGDRLMRSGHPVTNIAGQAFSQACDELLSAMTHGRLLHDGSPDIVSHFAHAVPKPTGDGGWRLVRRESGGYISIACAAAMIAHLAARPTSEPKIVVI